MADPAAREAFQALYAARFVPVLRAPSAALAVKAGRALVRGGCRMVEVTFTTPDAPRAIAELVAEGVVVGAGTVMNPVQAGQAYDAGAAFVVSPHLDPAVLAVGQACGRLAIPGALTPTEILACARDHAAPIVKVFPAASVGGPSYVKLVRDPLPGVSLFPTGGVTLADAPAYLAAGAIAVGAASDLAPRAAIEAGDEAALEAAARRWAAVLYADWALG